MKSTFLTRLRAWFAQGNRATWMVFFLFVFSLFIKTMVFHWTCFHSVLISSLWTHPTEFFRFWGGKVAPILFLGSFVFITKRYWWTIIANLLVDIWLIANLFYYKANTLFLSVEIMKMADNMSGFWDSLFAYMGWDIFSLLIITILYIPFLWFLHLHRFTERNYSHFTITMLISIALAVLCNYFYGLSMKLWVPQNSTTADIYKKWLSGQKYNCYFPFGNAYYYARRQVSVDYNAVANRYIKDFSIISYFPTCFLYSTLSPIGKIIQLTDSQQKEIESNLLYKAQNVTISPETNLIFLLFESLESWSIDTICGYAYMPNLQQLTKQEHALYADKLCSQVRHGNSADGQMIDVTGFLPLSDGATCRLYGRNDYPNYAHIYANSAIINPAPGMWQQSIVTFSYHFGELIEPQNGEHWGDKEVFEELSRYAQNKDTNFCVLGITITSHVPFAYGSTHPKHIVPNMPNNMSAYLNCLNYTDSCIGVLLNTIKNSPLANNTTIVISGDHTIFRSQDSKIDRFAQENDIPMQTGHTYVPLIIYSPNIKGNIQITDTCYQMDIFPTILHLIGAEDYYWHGFGVNLMDSAARHNRPVSEQEAYRLSDLMIRSDYFRTYMGVEE